MRQARVISTTGRLMDHLHRLPGIQIDVTAAVHIMHTLGIDGSKRIACHPYSRWRWRPRQLQSTYLRDPKQTTIAVSRALRALIRRLSGTGRAAIVPDHDSVGTVTGTPRGSAGSSGRLRFLLHK